MTHALLLVDDDENVLHGLARALHQQPYRIYTAKSGEEAMWVLKRQSIDVIVTDERMPGLLGTELLAWVAGNYPDVVGMVLTGFPSVETAVRAINEGAVYQFFIKPCKEVELAIAIRKALERRDELRRSRQLIELAPRPLDGAQGAATPEPFAPGEPATAPDT
jgi:DNA-binding NtrC family response regulator